MQGNAGQFHMITHMFSQMISLPANFLNVDSENKACHPGGRLNIKMSSYQYTDPHVKDKTVSRPSYL